MSRSLKKLLIVMAVLLSMVLLAGCSKADKASVTSAVTLKYARGFKIENLADGCKKVTDGNKRAMLLVPRGQKVPSGYKNLPVVYTPVKRVVITSTTQASLMRPLDVLGSIVGVTTEKDQWYLDQVKAGMESGNIQLVGGGMGPLDYDKIAALQPDLVFMSTGGPNDAQALQKLEELNIPVAVDNEWLENDPLGRLEWIRFIAAFYAKEPQASDFFAGAEKRITEITAKVAKVKDKPKVAWGMIYQGKAYVPAADSYVARMIAMAGGDYLFKDNKGTGSCAITFEEYYARGKEADIYIDNTMMNLGHNTIANITGQSKLMADLPALKKGNVWGYQPWYWQSLDKTDEVIGDLATIFHPDLFPGYQLKHFTKLPPA